MTVIGAPTSGSGSTRRRRRVVLGLAVVVVLAGAASGCGLVDALRGQGYAPRTTRS